jgi:hypothetical protein
MNSGLTLRSFIATRICRRHLPRLTTKAAINGDAIAADGGSPHANLL